MNDKKERQRLIREGERRNALTSFYEAHQSTLRAKLQELADQQKWETHDERHN